MLKSSSALLGYSQNLTDAASNNESAKQATVASTCHYLFFRDTSMTNMSRLVNCSFGLQFTDTYEASVCLYG